MVLWYLIACIALAGSCRMPFGAAGPRTPTGEPSGRRVGAMATTDEIIARTAPSKLVDHNLIDREVESLCDGMVRYEKRPARRRDGSAAEGLVNAWIVLNNPKQYNSYTTDMVKALILAFPRAP